MFRCHDMRSVLGRASLVLAVGVFVGCQALPPPIVEDSGASLVCSRRFPLYALQCRGGSSFHKGGGGGPIELNPAFQGGYNPSSKNEHEVWLQQQLQQQPYEPIYHQRSSVTSPRHYKPQHSSIVSSITNYFAALHQLCPSLCWTMVSCLLVFGMWQVTRFTGRPNPILSQWFVNSRSNTRRTMGASLILSSLSHIAPYHLVGNLMALSHFGPRVKGLLQERSPGYYKTTTTNKDVPLWPLMVSSAIVSNVAQIFLTNRPGGGSSLGLSGVTMALAAVQARAEPYRTFGILLWGVIPLSLQATQMLQLWIGVSLVGHLMASLLPQQRGDNNIAHMAHLGGLLVGVVYYECGIRGSSPLRVLRQWRRQVKHTLRKWVV